MNIIFGTILSLISSKLLSGEKKSKENSSLLSIRRPIEVKHVIPGRIRISAPSIKGDITSSQNLEKQLKHIDSVSEVKVSVHTGSIIIHYDAEKLEAALLVAAIIKLLGLESELDKVPEPLIRKYFKKATKALDQAVYDRTNGLVDIKTLGFILLTLTSMSRTKKTNSILPSLITLLFLTKGNSKSDNP